MACNIFKIDGAVIPKVQRIKPRHVPIMDERVTVDGTLRRDYIKTRWEAVVTLNGLTGAQRAEVISRVTGDMGVRLVELPDFTGDAFVSLPDDAPYFSKASRGDVGAGALTIEVRAV